MVNVTNLSTLERRILERVDESNEEAVQKEFARFETEVQSMSNEPDGIGQARLTSHEASRLPTGNQHSDSLTVIEWQCVKAAAIYYNVPDWTAKVDSSLSHEENIDLMKSISEGEMELAEEQAHTQRSFS